MTNKSEDEYLAADRSKYYSAKEVRRFIRNLEAIDSQGCQYDAHNPERQIVSYRDDPNSSNAFNEYWQLEYFSSARMEFAQRYASQCARRALLSIKAGDISNALIDVFDAGEFSSAVEHISMGLMIMERREQKIRIARENGKKNGRPTTQKFQDDFLKLLANSFGGRVFLSVKELCDSLDPVRYEALRAQYAADPGAGGKRDVVPKFENLARRLYAWMEKNPEFDLQVRAYLGK